MCRLFTKEEIAAKAAKGRALLDANPELDNIDLLGILARLNSRTYIGESGAYIVPVKEGDLIPIVDIGE